MQLYQVPGLRVTQIVHFARYGYKKKNIPIVLYPVVSRTKLENSTVLLTHTHWTKNCTSSSLFCNGFKASHSPGALQREHD